VSFYSILHLLEGDTSRAVYAVYSNTSLSLGVSGAPHISEGVLAVVIVLAWFQVAYKRYV